MFDLQSFLRSAAFAVVYAGIEYRYVNRREEPWTKEVPGFYEKPLFWKISPYQAYLLLPLFIVASFTTSVTAWAGNVFFVAFLEDITYFVWRGRWVQPGEWTTTLLGGVEIGGVEVPLWWPAAILIGAGLYLVPL